MSASTRIDEKEIICTEQQRRNRREKHFLLCNIEEMPQENGHRSARHSNRSTPLRASYNQNDNGTTEKVRPNREIKERGYYSELATVNPETKFEVEN